MSSHGGADDTDAQAGHLVIAPAVRSHTRPNSNSDGAVIAFHANQDPISETGGGNTGHER